MNREQAAFLVGGFAFGLLVGYGLFNALNSGPFQAPAPTAANVAAPAGPPAPTQVAGGGAPMVQRINELKRRVQAQPKDVEALLELGDLYRQASMWEQASEFYGRAVQADPDNIDLARALAYMYQDNGRCEEAVPHYQRAIEATPGNPDLLTDLGVCYRSLGQYDRALELFRRASGLDPEHWQSAFNTVVVTGLDLGRYEEADAAFEKLARIRPGAPELASLREALANKRKS